MSRTIVVGDVHGCIEELDGLLDRVALTPEDRVVFVGDLVGKGPRSHDVVARAREIGALSVRGNHDERLIGWLRAREEGREPPPLSPRKQKVAAELDDEDWAYLRQLPYWLELPEHKAIVVHAGLVPGVLLADQKPEHLLTLRSIRPDGSPSSKIEDGVPWASRWHGPMEVIFGHDAVRGLQRHRHATGLDTGCVYGGKLTAYVLPDRELVQVSATRAWASIEGAPGGPGPG